MGLRAKLELKYKGLLSGRFFGGDKEAEGDLHGASTDAGEAISDGDDDVERLTEATPVVELDDPTACVKEFPSLKVRVGRSSSGAGAFFGDGAVKGIGPQESREAEGGEVAGVVRPIRAKSRRQSYNRGGYLLVVTASCPPKMASSGWTKDDFILNKVIGNGRNSTVYHCNCRVSGTPCAIKVYPKAVMTHINKQQVMREITIHSACDHPNIVRLYAAWEDRHAIYFLQEYISKGDLFQELYRAGGAISERRAARDIIHPILDAIEYLHEKGVIHRDVKPENLLGVAGGSQLKLTDFGLSIDTRVDCPVTRLGTLDYMAPEVLRCPDKDSRAPKPTKQRYDEQVDVWAVGVLAYECLAGKPPFGAQKKDLTVAKVLSGELKVPPSVSEDAADFIAIALHVDPFRRATVEELRAHPWLARHMAADEEEDVNPRTRRASTLPSSREDLSPPPSPGRATAATASAAAALVVGRTRGTLDPSPTSVTEPSLFLEESLEEVEQVEVEGVGGQRRIGGAESQARLEVTRSMAQSAQDIFSRANAAAVGSGVGGAGGGRPRRAEVEGDGVPPPGWAAPRSSSGATPRPNAPPDSAGSDGSGSRRTLDSAEKMSPPPSPPPPARGRAAFSREVMTPGGGSGVVAGPGTRPSWAGADSGPGGARRGGGGQTPQRSSDSADSLVDPGGAGQAASRAVAGGAGAGVPVLAPTSSGGEGSGGGGLMAVRE